MASEQKQVAGSERLHQYFENLQAEVTIAHKIATTAKQKGIDLKKEVEISLAKNMAERVVGLISVVAPELTGTGVTERIIELEKEYGALDWRIALKIAAEIAEQKFCKFETKLQAMNIGIRTGFAYVTVGVVSSPLDGIVNIELKKRMDGKGEYLSLSFAGPVRNAGGTASAVSVIIADYVRKELGYATYDPTPDEIKRAHTELSDYHDRVTNLQYRPSEKETSFIVSHLPIEIAGEPSEKHEVSNYKDLPRVPVNIIRSGYCLVMSAGMVLSEMFFPEFFIESTELP